MRTKILLTSALAITLLTAEKCNKGAVSDDCTNIPRLNWQVDVKGYDSETALKLVADMQAAIKADAEVLKAIDNLEGAVKLTSELAKTINKNVKQSSQVSQEFWEQDLQHRQTLCFFESMVNNDNVPADVKAKYHEAILELSRIRADYMFEQKKELAKSRSSYNRELKWTCSV